MFKQVEKTPTIKDWIASAYGDPSVNLNDLAVFEAVSANTRPLRRRYGLHAGAVLEPSLIHEMPDVLKRGETVSLHSMHSAADLPVGRVFAANTHLDENGSPVLHTMFYMSNRDADLVDKVNKGIVNEVSVGLTPKEIRCSACGWDYKGADASIDNLLECTCPNGHTIGTDGVHARLHGLESWHELSLVDRGAVKGALILPRTKHTMVRTPDFERMAARGFEPSLLTLHAQCDFSPSPPREKPPMDELVNLKAAHIVLTRDHEAAQATLTAAKTELAAANTRVRELETQLAEAAKGDLAALKTQLSEVEAFVNEYAAAAFAAVGKDAATLPATLSEKVAAIKEARSQLALSIVPGGVAAGAAKGADPKFAPDYSAFTTHAKK